MTNVRPATKEDIDALCQLYSDFHEFHVQGVPKRLETLRNVWDEEKVKLAARLQEVIGSNDSAILVAEDKRVLLGFSELYLREDGRARAKPARRHCHLQSMFVAQSLRRRGIGRQLLSSSESWAQSRGASEIRLDIWEFSEGPLAFYERFGYGTYRRSLVRELDKK
jgi:GNAT superfamily N-acetyltransferase